MLRNLSIVMFLGLAACGGSKSKAPAAAENTTSDPGTTDTDPSPADECCCMTEMHSCSMRTVTECDNASGSCGEGDANSCDCDDGEEEP